MRALIMGLLLFPPTTGYAQLQRPAMSPCAFTPQVDTTQWQRVDAGAFTLMLPPGYSGGAVQGVDSSLDEWAGNDGQRIHADYGFYTGRFDPGPDSRMRDPIVVCEDGAGGTRPQIVIHRTFEGKHAVGLYWPRPGGRTIPWRNGPRPIALWVSAESPNPDHYPQLLAIIRSIHFK